MTDVQLVQIGMALAPALMAMVMGLMYVPQSRSFTRALTVLTVGFLIAFTMQSFAPPPEW